MPDASTTYFPPLIEETFDTTITTGTIAATTVFDSATDSASLITFPHYSVLAQQNDGLPYRGSHCMKVDINGSTTDSYISETGSNDVSLTETQHTRFYFYLSKNTVMANNDVFEIFAYRGASANEGVIAIQFTTAGGFVVGAGETAAAITTTPIELGKWYGVEIRFLANAGAGTVTAWLDGIQFAAATSLTTAASVEGRLGVRGGDSGTTGFILYDQYTVGTIDDTDMIGTLNPRSAETMIYGSSQTLFIGSGSVCNVSLIDGGNGTSQLKLYDTDTGLTSNANRIRMILKSTAADEIVDPAGVPVKFTRGCYLDMTDQAGSAAFDAQAIVKVKYGIGGTDGAVRAHASKRMPHPEGF